MTTQEGRRVGTGWVSTQRLNILPFIASSITRGGVQPVVPKRTDERLRARKITRISASNFRIATKDFAPSCFRSASGRA